MELRPIGVRRDGSYYTRVEWANVTESDPMFWVNNMIDDDCERNGGTWGANTTTTADAVLSFFGETQRVGDIRVFMNVGITISVLEELAKRIRIYASNTDEPRKLKSKDDPVDSVAWTLVADQEMEKKSCWQTIHIDKPFDARYIRVELVGNFCTEDNFIPWCEMSEIKLYPEKQA